MRDTQIRTHRCRAVANHIITQVTNAAVPYKPYIPGQHVVLSLPEYNFERHYSLISPGLRPARTLAVAIRRSGAGGLSDRIFANVHQGECVQLAGPSGRFRLPLESSQPLLLVAGGIGITPFLGYLRSLDHHRVDNLPQVTMIYATRDKTFHEELGALQRANITYRQFDSGRDLDKLLDGVGADVRAFLCGSEPFMMAVRNALLAKGVSRQMIQREYFTAPTPPAGDLLPAKITLARSGQSFRWHPEMPSILAAADAAGLNLPAGCRAGECESCALRLMAGRVRHAGDVEEGVCLTCCAVPDGDVVLDA